MHRSPRRPADRKPSRGRRPTMCVDWCRPAVTPQGARRREVHRPGRGSPTPPSRGISTASASGSNTSAAPNPFGCRNSRRDTRTPSDHPGSVGHGCFGGYGGYGGGGGAGIGYGDGFHAAGLITTALSAWAATRWDFAGGSTRHPVLNRSRGGRCDRLGGTCSTPIRCTGSPSPVVIVPTGPPMSESGNDWRSRGLVPPVQGDLPSLVGLQPSGSVQGSAVVARTTPQAARSPASPVAWVFASGPDGA